MPKELVTIPNLLTAYRFAAVPFLVILFASGGGNLSWFAAFILFVSAAFTDLADGYIARRQQLETPLGKLMDPLADKVLVAAPLIMLIPLGRIPAWVSYVILARELMITGFRGVAASAGIVVAASRLGKLKSVVQYVALSVLIFPQGLLALTWLHDLGRLILLAAMVLTVWSGIEYFVRLRQLYLGGRSR